MEVGELNSSKLVQTDVKQQKNSSNKTFVNLLTSALGKENNISASLFIIEGASPPNAVGESVEMSSSDLLELLNSRFGASPIANELQNSTESIDSPVLFGGSPIANKLQNVEFLDQEDVSFLENITKLLSELGDLDVEILDNPRLEAIIGLMPEDLKLEIVQIFQADQQASQTFNSEEVFKSPAKLAALLLLFSQYVNEVDDNFSNRKIKDLPNILQQLSTKLTSALKNENNLDPMTIKKLENSFRSLFESMLGESKLLSKDSNTDRKKEYLQSLFSRTFQDSIETRKQQNTPNLATVSTIMTDETVSGPISKIQQFVLYTDQQKNQSVNQEEFIKKIEQLLGRSNFSKVNGNSRLLIKLYPEQLGSLRIELVQKDSEIIAKIIASTKQGKDLLESQLQGLKQTFINQNITVDKIEITQQIQQQFDKSNREHQQQQDQNDQQDEANQNEDGEKDDHSFAAPFEEVLLNTKV